MCGLFGVRGSAHAAAVTHLGLYSLQHRGQESAGIISVDAEHRAHRLRAMGLVSDAFPPDRIENELPGSIGRSAIRATARPGRRRSTMPSRCSSTFAGRRSGSRTTGT